jgi:hypothetical protein
MLIHGEGGTGKSRVIQTITESFKTRGVSRTLLKAAYTGIAASLIGGKTLHTIGHIPVNKTIERKAKGVSDESKRKLQDFWLCFDYLIIDECSMISKSFLSELEKCISIGKSATSNSGSFGGLSVILCGDFHQFPPVACSVEDALFAPVRLGVDTAEQQLGRMIYEEFSTVVVLTAQMRVVDTEWRDLLRRLRYGETNTQDIVMLKRLVISHPDCPAADYENDYWGQASLVTPRHGVRRAWNEAALSKHCRRLQERIYIIQAEDRIKGRPLTLAEKYGVALRGSERTAGGRRRKPKQDLPDSLSIAIGAEVMVIQNIETDLDMANGSRGRIVDIVLHPEEPTPLEHETTVTLQNLPVYILVKLERTRVQGLDGLEDGVVPILPRQQTMRISVQQKRGSAVSRTVKREQYPLTLAYAFTDYRSQGQTIVPVIIDIATPPSGGKLSLFNIYVALSRSAGRHSIRLLRDFDEKIFFQGHSTELLSEDDRIESLNKETQAWWNEVKSRQSVI